MPYYRDSFSDFQHTPVTVAWSKKTWEKHARKHPVLVNFPRTSQLIAQALTKPSVVFQTKRGGTEQTRIYYRETEVIATFQARFIKIVTMRDTQQGWVVKTVYDQYKPLDLNLKERNYPKKFKEVWNDKNNSL